MINEKIFGDANDKYVRNYILYAGEDGYLCSDKDCENRLSKEEVTNFFVKGFLLATNDGSYYKPINYAQTEEYATVGFFIDGETFSGYSKEYVPEDEDNGEEENGD